MKLTYALILLLAPALCISVVDNEIKKEPPDPSDAALRDFTNNKPLFLGEEGFLERFNERLNPKKESLYLGAEHQHVLKKKQDIYLNK
ncbi:hypothetical protein [Endozoicomonas sp. Mp262]|uniref:hypothetical protein n=1 Tax=Endozoicomonas sp. Mp262 TaxID=2919499 RepID=UPI0021D9FCD9